MNKQLIELEESSKLLKVLLLRRGCYSWTVKKSLDLKVTGDCFHRCFSFLPKGPLQKGLEFDLLHRPVLAVHVNQ